MAQDGIGILRDSNAELSGNNISGNVGDGVLVSENSSLRLVESPEGGIFISANSTIQGSLNGASAYAVRAAAWWMECSVRSTALAG